jgi:hypothetical protein
VGFSDSIQEAGIELREGEEEISEVPQHLCDHPSMQPSLAEYMAGPQNTRRPQSITVSLHCA